MLHELGADFVTASKAEKRERRGFVYIMSHPAFDGYVKVGRAFDPESRLSNMQTGCPHRAYRLEHYWYFDDAHRAEEEIHELLDKYRWNGEWFFLPTATARERVQEYRRRWIG